MITMTDDQVKDEKYQALLKAHNDLKLVYQALLDSYNKPVNGELIKKKRWVINLYGRGSSPVRARLEAHEVIRGKYKNIAIVDGLKILFNEEIDCINEVVNGVEKS